MVNINIEKILNKWFEMKLKTYDRLEHNDSIYFYYDGEEYAEIMVDKKYKYIYCRWKLYKEFSEIIPLEYLEFEKYMIKWVEDTFGLKGFTPNIAYNLVRSMLKIPLV